ncbi:MAG TPA: hypothetical protein VLI90_02215 [Tepidisphaeraceae bacterium]|nr:hypothetical protein [Tepidisphaeraceae bacterium]
MLNTPLPRDLNVLPSATWRERRRRRRLTVVTSASLRPVAQHVFDATDEGPQDAVAEQLVIVHDVSLDGLGLRSRLPLDVCAQYRIHCEDRNVFLRNSRLRVVSCRRGRDGLYEIGAQLCNGR